MMLLFAFSFCPERGVSAFGDKSVIKLTLFSAMLRGYNVETNETRVHKLCDIVLKRLSSNQSLTHFPLLPAGCRSPQRVPKSLHSAAARTKKLLKKGIAHYVYLWVNFNKISPPGPQSV